MHILVHIADIASPDGVDIAYSRSFHLPMHL